MIRFKKTYGLLMGLFILVIATPGAHASESFAAKVSFLTGDAVYKPKSYLDWQNITQGDSIPEGSLVRLSKGGKGRIELTLSDGSVIRMLAPSKMKIKQASRKGIGVRLNLLLGRLWSKVRKIRHRRSFEIHTITAVLGVRGTSYDTFVGDDQGVDVRVFEGSVAAAGKDKQQNVLGASPRRKSLAPKEIAGPKEVSLSEWLVVLESMQHLRISAQGVPSKPVAMDINEEKKNEWIQWNLERDKVWNAQHAAAKR